MLTSGQCLAPGDRWNRKIFPKKWPHILPSNLKNKPHSEFENNFQKKNPAR